MVIQTVIRINRHINISAIIHTHALMQANTYIYKDRQTNRHAGRQAYRQTPPYIHKDRQIEQIDTQADRQVERIGR